MHFHSVEDQKQIALDRLSQAKSQAEIKMIMAKDKAEMSKGVTTGNPNEGTSSLAGPNLPPLSNPSKAEGYVREVAKAMVPASSDAAPVVSGAPVKPASAEEMDKMNYPREGRTPKAPLDQPRTHPVEDDEKAGNQK